MACPPCHGGASDFLSRGDLSSADVLAFEISQEVFGKVFAAEYVESFSKYFNEDDGVDNHDLLGLQLIIEALFMANELTHGEKV